MMAQNMAGPAGCACAKLVRPGGPGKPEKTRVQRREILLIMLLVVLVLFYVSIAADRAPGIIAGQKAHAERLNELDEEVLGTPPAGSEQDGE